MLPSAFKWEFFLKVVFLNTVKAKVIILTRYVETNETLAINKFQRSRLTFALSAKVAHIVVHQYIKNIVFSQTIGPIELKFHVKTPYDKSTNFYTKYVGHMTKMATTPIYGKNLLKIFFSRTRRPLTLRLGM